jgi:hypothetical protein
LLATHAAPVDVALMAAAFTAANLPTQPGIPVPVAAPFIGIAASAAVPTTPPAPSIVGSSIVDLDLISLGSSEVAEGEEQGPRTLSASGTDDANDDDAIDDPSSAGEWLGDGASTVAMAYRAGATREASHDACFADAPWSAIPKLDELAACELGDLSAELPSPVLLMAVILTSFEGYHRFRTDHSSSSAGSGETADCCPRSRVRPRLPPARASRVE